MKGKAGRRGPFGSRRALVRASFFLAASLTLSAASCGIFDTRDSEPPGNGGSEVPSRRPLNPADVLFNYVNAVKYFSQANYDETLAADFEFLPDDEDRAYFLSQGSDVFQDWDKSKEAAAVQRIFGDSDSLTVTFVEVSSTPITDVVLLDLDYVFRRVIFRRGEEDSVASFRGLARVHMREDQSGFWAIDKWTDFSSPGDDRTWGFLKGTVTSG